MRHYVVGSICFVHQVAMTLGDVARYKVRTNVGVNSLVLIRLTIHCCHAGLVDHYLTAADVMLLSAGAAGAKLMTVHATSQLCCTVTVGCWSRQYSVS